MFLYYMLYFIHFIKQSITRPNDLTILTLHIDEWIKKRRTKNEWNMYLPHLYY